MLRRLQDAHAARNRPHDGSLAKLEAVIDFYSEGGRPHPLLDSDIRPVSFILEEKHALVAFLQSLNGRAGEDANSQTISQETKPRKGGD